MEASSNPRLIRPVDPKVERMASIRKQYAKVGGPYVHQIKMAIEQSKMQGTEILERAKELRSVTDSYKKQNTIKQHKFQWLQEARNMEEERASLEKSLHEFLVESSSKSKTMQEIYEEEITLSNERRSLANALREQVSDVRSFVLHFSIAPESEKEHIQTEYEDMLKAIKSSHIWLDERLKEDEDKCISSLQITMEESEPTANKLPDWWLERSSIDLLLKKIFEEQFKELQANYNTGLELLKARYTLIMSPLVTGDDAECFSKNGDWSEDEHFHFKKIFREYADGNHTRDACLDRLALEMPQKSIDSLYAHYEWYMYYRSYKYYRLSLHRKFFAQKKELFAQAIQSFQEAEKIAKERQDRKIAQSEFDSRRQKLQNTVTEWKSQQQARIMKEAEEARIAREREIAREQQEEEKRRQEREEKKKAVGVYKDSKKQLEMEAKRLADEQAAIQEEIKKKRAEINAFRVKYRSKKWEEKQEQKLMRMEAEIAEMQEREERLEKLRQQVRVEAPDDPDRVYRQTEGKSLTAENPDNRPLFNVNGYTDNQIMCDPRFKIDMALRAAGVQNSDYARMIMKSVKPFRPPRLDTYTTQQVNEMKGLS